MAVGKREPIFPGGKFSARNATVTIPGRSPQEQPTVFPHSSIRIYAGYPNPNLEEYRYGTDAMYIGPTSIACRLRDLPPGSKIMIYDKGRRGRLVMSNPR